VAAITRVSAVAQFRAIFSHTQRIDCLFLATSHTHGADFAPDNMTVAADGKTALLFVTDQCCAWKNATASIIGSKLHADAVSANGKVVVQPVGTLSSDGCTIEWSQRWAPWTKQAHSSVA
jgi:hypothetical protein